MNLEIQVLAWDRHKNVAGLNLITGSPMAIQVLTNDNKPACKTPHTITKTE